MLNSEDSVEAVKKVMDITKEEIDKLKQDIQSYSHICFMTKEHNELLLYTLENFESDIELLTQHKNIRVQTPDVGYIDNQLKAIDIQSNFYAGFDKIRLLLSQYGSYTSFEKQNIELILVKLKLKLQTYSLCEKFLQGKEVQNTEEG